jgi:hypothetical protein
MAVVLIAGLVASLPKPSTNGRPHSTFFLRAESDGQIWLVKIFHEDEITVVDNLAINDAVAFTGSLEVRAEEDRQGRKRIAFSVVAKQLLVLQRRSRMKAAAMIHNDQPGFARPRIG